MAEIISYYAPRIAAVSMHEWIFYLGVLVVFIAAVTVAQVNRGDR